MEKRQSLPQVVLGKLDRDTLNNEVRRFPHIIYKKTLKTGLKTKMKDLKPHNSEKKTQAILSLISSSLTIFLRTRLFRQRLLKSKNNQMGLHEAKKLLHSEGNHHRDEKVAHRAGGDICK